MAKSSLKKFSEGGPLMLVKINANQSVDRKGAWLRSPLIRTRARVCEDSYIMLAKTNMAEEVRP